MHLRWVRGSQWENSGPFLRRHYEGCTVIRKNLPTFQRCLLPLSSGRWVLAPLKRWTSWIQEFIPDKLKKLKNKNQKKVFFSKLIVDNEICMYFVMSKKYINLMRLRYTWWDTFQLWNFRGWSFGFWCRFGICFFFPVLWPAVKSKY